MLSPGNPVGGTVTLTSNTSDTGGSGIATVAYELAPNGGSFNSQSASWDTTLVSDGLYDLRVVATDVAGNSTTSTLDHDTRRQHAAGPDLLQPGCERRRQRHRQPRRKRKRRLAREPVRQLRLQAATAIRRVRTPAPALRGTPPTLPGGDGLYDLRARATDDAGNTTNVENTSIRVDNAAPTVAITAPPAAINGSLPSPTTLLRRMRAIRAGSGVDEVQFFECSEPEQRLRDRRLEPARHRRGARPVQRLVVDPRRGRQPRARGSGDRQRRPSVELRSATSTSTGTRRTRRSLTKPADPSNCGHADLHVHVLRTRLDVRVQHRRRVRSPPARARTTSAGLADNDSHLRRARDRRGRQHRRERRLRGRGIATRTVRSARSTTPARTSARRSR